MKELTLAVVIGFFLSAAPVPGQGTSSGSTRASYTISGTLLDQRTQSPVPAVLMLLNPVRAGQTQPLACRSDEHGFFQFPGLRADKYMLSAQRHGERIKQLDGHGQFSSAVVAGPGLDSEHIQFFLPGEASLSGMVRDDDGDPVGGATVFLLREQVSDGKRRVQMVDQGTTAESGRYRFTQLRPGTYYLAVMGQPWYNAHQSGELNSMEVIGATTPVVDAEPSALDVAYAVTYSGDTTDPSAAQPIQLVTGQRVSMPVALHAVPALHVRLISPNSLPGGVAVSTAFPSGGFPSNLRLLPLGPGGVALPMLSVPSITTFGGSNWVEMNGLAPGTYRLSASVPGANGQSEISNLLLTLTTSSELILKPAGATVAGRLVADFQSDLSGVALTISGGDDTSPQTVPLQQNGTFRFPQRLGSGRYQMTLAGASPVTIYSISDGRHVSIGGKLTIQADGGDSAVKLLIQAGVAKARSRVSGVAMRDGGPVSGAMVLLVPAQVNDDTYIGRDQSDSDGSFTIPNVPPGTYTLVSIEGDTEDFEYRNASTLKPYLVNASLVSVPQPGERPVEVKVQKLRSLSN